MKAHRITKWEDIQGGFTDKLLLGNGASRAVWGNFRYPSLYEEAKRAERIDPDLTKLFSDFGTSDFEYILRLLSQTKRVNKILHIPDRDTPRLYGKLKKTLIDTIRDVHPTHEQVKNYLLPMAHFMKRFKTVLSLNYDLLVYWAMLDGNDKYGKWFKDGFVDEGRFDNDYKYLYDPWGPEGATLVFYPHGSLIFATDLGGIELKLSRKGERILLNEILDIWEAGEYIPLFVSEGVTEEKLKAIRRSNYLKAIYDREVDSKCESLTVYGWSFRDEDAHILKGFIGSGIERIAVAVHSGSVNTQVFCGTVKNKIDQMYYMLKDEKKLKRIPLVYFFNADSKDCWIN